MIDGLVAAKAFIILGVFAALFAAERLVAYANRPGSAAEKRRRLLRNVGVWLVTVPISPLIVIPVTAFAASHALWQRPDWWSGAPGLLLDIAILDLWMYWMHRAWHKVPVMWRLHEIHHRDEFLDATSAFRFHAVEVVASALVRCGVIIALAMPLSSVLIYEIAAALVVMFHHSNVALPRWLERPLSRVIVTPSIHWVHHHTPREDTNSNYATVFSLWDPLFGTRSKTVRGHDLPIGLDYTHDISLFRLMVQPFRGGRHRAGDE